jgi:hypothetical protein
MRIDLEARAKNCRTRNRRDRARADNTSHALCSDRRKILATAGADCRGLRFFVALALILAPLTG